MEFIFGLTEGRRAVIYDEGNQIILLFVQRGSIANRVILEREYHSELNAIAYDNKIYLAYMTVSYAIAWMELGGTGRVILYANDTNRCHVTNLKTSVIADKLALLYKSEIEDKKTWRLQYILPLENRKSYMLCEWEESIDYQLEFLGEKSLLFITKDSDTKHDYKHYYIEEKENQRYALCEARIMSDIELQKIKTECREEIKRELVKKNEQEMQEQKQRNEQEMQEQKQRNEQEIQEQKRRNEQYEKERKQLEIDFKKQYNELVEFTKQLQVEGKHWREMYYRSMQNKTGNT